MATFAVIINKKKIPKKIENIFAIIEKEGSTADERICRHSICEC